MAIDTGSQDRWFNNEPAPVQYNTDNYNLGAEDRWFNSEPSPVQYQQTGGAPPATINQVILSLLGVQ